MDAYNGIFRLRRTDVCFTTCPQDPHALVKREGLGHEAEGLVPTLSNSISRWRLVASAVDTFSVKSLICSQAFVSSVSSWAVLFSRLPRRRLSNSKAVEALVPLLLMFDRSERMAASSCASWGGEGGKRGVGLFYQVRILYETYF